MELDGETYTYFLMENEQEVTSIPDVLLPMVEESIEVKTRKYEIQARFNGGWLTYDAILRNYQ